MPDTDKVELTADEFQSLMWKMVTDKKITLYVGIFHSKARLSVFYTVPVAPFDRRIGRVQEISGRGFLAIPDKLSRETKLFEYSELARDYLLEVYPCPISMGCWSFDV